MLTKYQILYSASCHVGKKRDTNQDNLWCSNQYLDVTNTGLQESMSGYIPVSKVPLFAVFDGMGGEQKGEYASYIAAKTLDENCGDRLRFESVTFLRNVCRQMNSKICKFQQENNVRSMGTTGAIVLFGKEKVTICNIGDSRVYRLNNGELKQISVDHVQDRVMVGTKPPLTQCLGISEQEFIIEPYIAQGEYKKSDKYLICSDGLTDMVSEEQIQKIMQESATEKCSELLLQEALNNGGKDNITVIVCEIKKKSIFS